MNLVDLLLGSGVLGSGTLLGFVLGRIGRRKPEASPYTCGCKHSLAVHDPKTGECNAAVKSRKYHEKRGIYIEVPAACACRQYVGERPVDIEGVLDDFVRKHPPPAEPSEPS